MIDHTEEHEQDVGEAAAAPDTLGSEAPDVTSASVTEEVAPAAGPKKTIEEWATEKKFLPATTPKKRPGPVKARVAGMLAAGNGVDHNPNFWKFAAARAGEGWPVGFEITEADFDEAIANHTDLPHGA